MANNCRLIDANAPGIGKAKREAFDNPAYADGWNSAIAIIESAPTVDAVEVVHGRWKRTPVSSRLYCSICDKIPVCQVDTPYCPNCGAKMDGDGNG